MATSKKATPVVSVSTVVAPKAGALRECNAEHVKALSAAIKAEDKAALTVGQAINVLFDDGLRSEHIIKSHDLFSQAVYSAIEAAIIAAKITLKADRTLLLMSAAEAKAINQGARRTELTQIVSKYFGNLRGALDRRAIDAGEKPAPEKKQKAIKADAVADVPESGDSTESVKTDIKGITPTESREKYMEGLNLMLIAARTHADARVRKVADRHCEMFQVMLRELA